jgi:acyl-CoA thioester hydrolase
MQIPAPLMLHREVVRPEWIDYNGHMNVAYYVLAFDHACDAFLDFIGLDEAYRGRTGGTTFAVDCHVTYQREVAEGDPLRFATHLIDYDEKRIRHFHQMYHAGDGFLAATCEWMSLHIDLDSRRVVPMPPDVTGRLAEVMQSHRSLPRPPEAGRAVGDPRIRT